MTDRQPASTARRVHASTHIFNFRLYIEGLKRLRLVGSAIAILALTISALIPIATWMDTAASEWYLEHGVREVSFGTVCIPAGVMVLISPVFVGTLFSFLFKRRDSDFFHAIPYTRTCVYVSFVSATVTVIAAIITGCGVVAGLLWTLCPYTIIDVGLLCASIPLCILAAIMLSGFMLLAMTVTGTGGTAVLLFALFASLGRIMAAVLLGMMDGIALLDINSLWYTSPLSPFWFLPLSAPTFLLELFYTGNYVDGLLYTPANILYSVVVTLLIYTLAGVLYARRHSEMAGNSAPGRKSQAFFRILFTLPFALLLPLCLWNGTDISFILVVLVVTLLVYFLYELITTKRARNLLKALPGLLWVAAATLLFTGVFFGVRGVILHQSIPASDMESVCFDGRWDGMWSYSDTVLQETSFTDPAILATVSDCLADAQRLEREEGLYAAIYQRTTVSIHLKNGRVIRRRILIEDESYRAIHGVIAQKEAYRDIVLDIPPSSDLRDVRVEMYAETLQNNAVFEHNTPAFDDLYRVFVEEYNTLSDEEKLAHIIIDPDYVTHEGNDLRFYIKMYGFTRVSYNQYTYNYENNYIIDQSLPRTMAALLALWSQHVRGVLTYPIRQDLTDKAAILADLSAYFAGDSRIPLEDFPQNGHYETTMSVWRADGTQLFEEQNLLTASSLVTIADRLSATLVVSEGTDAAAFQVTEDTCIIRWRFSLAEYDYASSVELYLICNADAAAREALRKAMW